jgi:hypothetical protein
VPPGDVEALATAIGRLADDRSLRARLAETGAADIVAVATARATAGAR